MVMRPHHTDSSALQLEMEQEGNVETAISSVIVAMSTITSTVSVAGTQSVVGVRLTLSTIMPYYGLFSCDLHILDLW